MRYLFVFVLLIGIFGIMNYASSSEDGAPLPRFVATQNKGDIRVTLVEISQRVFFTSEWFRSGDGQQPASIPCAYIELVVEYLGENKQPIPHALSFRLFHNGALIEPREDCIGGGQTSVHPYTPTHSDLPFPMPKVADPNRTHVQTVMRVGIDLPERAVDLKLRMGFDDAVEEFVFKDVPLH